MILVTARKQTGAKNHKNYVPVDLFTKPLRHEDYAVTLRLSYRSGLLISSL